MSKNAQALIKAEIQAILRATLGDFIAKQQEKKRKMREHDELRQWPSRVYGRSSR